MDHHLLYMPKYIKNIKYYRDVQKKLDAMKTRNELIHLRNEHLQRQKVLNYQLEYDRIRGLISTPGFNAETSQTLKERRDKLRKMGARMINSSDD